MIKLNLQHFADAGTLVNTTAKYINAYDGTPTEFDGTNTLAPTMKTYYDTELLENARPEFVHAQFGKKQNLPANRGKSIEWRKWNTLADASQLTEGVIPTGQKLGQSSINTSISQYGTYVTVSDQLELHAIDDVILGATEELGASAGSTMDKLIRNVLVQGTSVLYADKVGEGGVVTEVTERTELDKTAKLTPTVVNKAVTILKKMKAPKFSDGKYVAIIHPSVAYDLRQSPEWIEAHKYASVKEIYNGEIGELHGTRFVETTEAKIVTSTGGAVYLTLFLGRDAFGEIDPDGAGMEMIIKDKSEVGGPLNQFSTIGYKFSTATKILYEDRMLRVESCSEYSDVDEEN